LHSRSVGARGHVIVCFQAWSLFKVGCILVCGLGILGMSLIHNDNTKENGHVSWIDRINLWCEIQSADFCIFCYSKKSGPGFLHIHTILCLWVWESMEFKFFRSDLSPIELQHSGTQTQPGFNCCITLRDSRFDIPRLVSAVNHPRLLQKYNRYN